MRNGKSLSIEGDISQDGGKSICGEVSQWRAK